MGMGALKQHKTKTLRKFTNEEIFEILKLEGTDLPSEPFFTETLGVKCVCVKGVGKYDVSVTPMGKSIICGEMIRKGERTKSIGLDMLTNNWSSLLDKESKENAEVTEKVGLVVDRLFANRQ